MGGEAGPRPSTYASTAQTVAVCQTPGWGARVNHAEAVWQKNKLWFLIIDPVSNLTPDISCAV